MGCTMPGIPALHHLLKFAHMCVHQLSDAINHLILCVHLLCMPSIFPSIRVFSNQSALRIRWPKYWSFSIRQFSLVQSLSHVQLCNPMDCSTPGLLFITNSWSLLKLMSIELVKPSNHLILCHPLLLLLSILPNIRIFSKESVLRIRWPKYWSFSFNIRPPNEYSGLISFTMD